MKIFVRCLITRVESFTGRKKELTVIRDNAVSSLISAYTTPFLGLTVTQNRGIGNSLCVYSDYGGGAAEWKKYELITM